MERERQLAELAKQGKTFSTSAPRPPQERGHFTAGAGTDPKLGEGNSYVDLIEAWVIVVANGDGPELAADLYRAAKEAESGFSDRVVHLRVESWQNRTQVDAVLEIWRRHADYAAQPSRSDEIAKSALIAYSNALLKRGYSCRGL